MVFNIKYKPGTEFTFYAGAVEIMGSGEPAPQSMESWASAQRWPPR